ncbi:hypothetical protein EDD11_000566 [Mortierella claussenii]|nr:hypothetical protein EDD11_000566 [Mortierella claussenii]
MTAGVDTVDCTVEGEDELGAVPVGIRPTASDDDGDPAADPLGVDGWGTSALAGGRAPCFLLKPSKISYCAGSSNCSARAKNSLGVTAFD